MALKGQSKRQRVPHGSARERIIDTAEGLFAEAGLDGVSFRDLASAAGVSLSATHYYFESKHALLAEVFTRQARVMIERRLALLDAAKTGPRGAPLEEILDAFLRPAFEVTGGDRNDVFNRLLARLAVERGDIAREIKSAAFDENDGLFIAALGRALPNLRPEDLHWRFHLLVGAMIYTISDAGQIEGLSRGLCSTTDTDRALDEMVHSFAAVFRASPARA